ncbi:hypothetical protein EJB05_14221, partial [Eragrostis curvula]
MEMAMPSSLQMPRVSMARVYLCHGRGRVSAVAAWTWPVCCRARARRHPPPAAAKAPPCLTLRLPLVVAGFAASASERKRGESLQDDSNLFLWSWKADSKGIAGWEQLRVIKLNTLLSLPEGAWVSSCGFMEGTDTIFISTSVSIFTLKLKSGQIRNVGPRSGYGPIVPYMNYYTRGFVVARLLSP